MTRICLHCEKTFVPKNNSKICSEKCRKERREEQKKNWRKSVVIKKVAEKIELAPFTKEQIEEVKKISSRIDYACKLGADTMFEIQKLVKLGKSLEEVVNEFKRYKVEYIKSYYERIKK